MNKAELLDNIKRVEKIASGTKLERMFAQPFKYVNAIFFREFVYKKSKKAKSVIGHTFFNSPMHLLLPSSTDIYLTGGKSHDSEIRLAKFLINQLEKGDTFIDVGAHYGYFSLLGSKLVGDNGKVFSFEASPVTFNVLSKNKTNFRNLKAYNLAISDENGTMTFYEFPNLYSEYNSFDIDQFKKEAWFAQYPPNALEVKTIALDNFVDEENINPKIIKIDVEGAEYKVINGLKSYLTSNAPQIVIEFLSEKRGNIEHKKAESLLQSLGYKSFAIDNNGALVHIDSIAQFIDSQNMESDNIVFSK